MRAGVRPREPCIDDKTRLAGGRGGRGEGPRRGGVREASQGQAAVSGGARREKAMNELLFDYTRFF